MAGCLTTFCLPSQSFCRHRNTHAAYKRRFDEDRAAGTVPTRHDFVKLTRATVFLACRSPSAEPGHDTSSASRVRWLFVAPRMHTRQQPLNRPTSRPRVRRDGRARRFGGVSVTTSQYVGWRFQTTQTLTIDHIGAHMLSIPGNPGNIFATLVRLPSITSDPAGSPFNPDEVVATTTFRAPFPSAEVFTPFSATIAPALTRLCSAPASSAQPAKAASGMATTNPTFRQRTSRHSSSGAFPPPANLLSGEKTCRRTCELSSRHKSPSPATSTTTAPSTPLTTSSGENPRAPRPTTTRGGQTSAALRPAPAPRPTRPTPTSPSRAH